MEKEKPDLFETLIPQALMVIAVSLAVFIAKVVFFCPCITH